MSFFIDAIILYPNSAMLTILLKIPRTVIEVRHFVTYVKAGEYVEPTTSGLLSFLIQ